MASTIVVPARGAADPEVITLATQAKADIETLEGAAATVDYTSVAAALAAASGAVAVNGQSVTEVGALTFKASAASHVISVPDHATAAGVDLSINAQKGAATFDGGSVVLTLGAKGAGGASDGSIAFAHPSDGEFLALTYSVATQKTTATAVSALDLVAGSIDLKASNTLLLKANGTTVIEVGTTGLGLFGHAQAAQPADISAITDNTTGTPSLTLAAIPDPTDTPATADALRDDIVTNILPSLRNSLASMAAQINALRSASRAIGAMA